MQHGNSKAASSIQIERLQQHISHNHPPQVDDSPAANPAYALWAFVDQLAEY